MRSKNGNYQESRGVIQLSEINHDVTKFVLLFKKRDYITAESIVVYDRLFFAVGVSGFEPPTSSSRTKRANRTALHPEKQKQNIIDLF